MDQHLPTFQWHVHHIQEVRYENSRNTTRIHLCKHSTARSNKVHLQSSKVSILLLFQHIDFSFIPTLATTSNKGQMHVYSFKIQLCLYLVTITCMRCKLVDKGRDIESLKPIMVVRSETGFKFKALNSHFQWFTRSSRLSCP